MLTKKHAVDDDFESPRNVVIESNVDYLSYKFDEMDLAASWRVLTKQKLNIVNGIRLENASWRTWAKQRNNLKTISPDTLNWLKDSDVTWLYGPLHSVIKEIGESDRYAKPKVSTTEDTLGLMTSPHKQDQENNNSQDEVLQPRVTSSFTENISTTTPTGSIPDSPIKRPNASPLQNGKPLKSALKKVTMSDLLKRSASELQINNDPNGISISQANQQLGAFSPAVIASHRQPKLRFNQYVEQCIALSVDDENNKKKNSRVRMAELKDTTTTDDNEDDDDDDEDSTSSDNYGDESDAGSIIMMRRRQKLRSIKKIEPTLLKTNSRSDHDLSASDDDSSDEDIMPVISASGYRHQRNNHNHKSNSSKYMDWDVESAESDAFVKHIINVSKGKKPLENRDPAADRTPVNPEEWNDGNVTDATQGKSDYDYVFDDDDWDTNSEHPEDAPFISASDEYSPVAPTPPVGCQIAKAPANKEPILPNVHPTIERSLSGTRAAEDMQNNRQHYDSNGSNNSSLFSGIAHWASSHLWPADNK